MLYRLYNIGWLTKCIPDSFKRYFLKRLAFLAIDIIDDADESYQLPQCHSNAPNTFKQLKSCQKHDLVELVVFHTLSSVGLQLSSLIKILIAHNFYGIG